MSNLDRLGPLNPNGWPVRARLAAVSAVLTFLILLGFAFVVGRLAVNKLEGNFREEAQSVASDIANRLEIRQGPAGTEIGDRGFNLDDPIGIPEDSIRIVDAKGNVIRGATQPINERVPAPGDPENVGGFTVASQRILSQGSFGPSVFVQYIRDRDSLEATTDRLWLFLGAGVLAGTVLAALAGLAVAQRAMSPIASLTSAAREVAMTRDPSRRIPLPETDDEVAELAGTLDQMLRQLDAARSETEQMVQAQREFVADASHELRTPLTSILANLELLQARLAERGGDSEDAEIVAGALGSSQRMRRLVSDLLLLARADAGRAGQRAVCDLAEIADAAVAEVRAAFGTHSLALEADDDLALSCNRDDLHRLITNLAENAVRHTPPGTNVRVVVRRDDDGDHGVVEVTDDGPGLPSGIGEQIFARFVRGAGPADLSADGGTGLGLAIVRAVAVAHGGSVEAGAAAEGGARFTVRLPLATADYRPLEAADISAAKIG